MWPFKKRKSDKLDGYAPTELVKADPWTKPDALAQIEQHARETHLDAWNADGFRNELTGIGDWMRDRTMGGRESGLEFLVKLLPGVDCENRWRGSDLGARVVETIPDEMTREGWEVSIQPDEEDETKQDAFPNPQQPGMPALPPPPEPKVGVLPEFDDDSSKVVEEIDGILEEIDCVEEVWKALCYERAYGGGGILLGADDGQEDLAEPLNEESVDEVTHLTAFRGGWDGELVAWSYYQDPRQPNYGKPETYMLRNLTMPSVQAPGSRAAVATFAPTITWVHESRLLVFPGVSVSHQARVQMRGWGDSIFTRIDEILSHYNQTWGGIANLMTDFSQGILKIKDLAQSLGANNRNGTKNVTNRALALNISKSVARVLMLDAEEEYKRDTVSLGGLAEILQQFALRLAAAADMPVTLLMGQAPAGLNATGESDVRFFYDRVAAKQRKRMLPQLRRLIRLIMLSRQGPCGGKEPARWNLKANPLFQMSEAEQAALRKTVAETDNIYISAGVLSAEEVAASAYGGSEWTMERVIDFKGRQEMAEQAEADKEEHAKAMAEAIKAQAQQPKPEEQATPEEKAEPETEPKEDEPKSDFDDDQPRGGDGKWAGGSGGTARKEKVAKIADHLRSRLEPHAETHRAQVEATHKEALTQLARTRDTHLAGTADPEKRESIKYAHELAKEELGDAHREHRSEIRSSARDLKEEARDLHAGFSDEMRALDRHRRIGETVNGQVESMRRAVDNHRAVASDVVGRFQAGRFDGFSEGDHPRDQGGKFTDGSGSGGGVKKSKEAAKAERTAIKLEAKTYAKSTVESEHAWAKQEIATHAAEIHKQLMGPERAKALSEFATKAKEARSEFKERLAKEWPDHMQSEAGRALAEKAEKSTHELTAMAEDRTKWTPRQVAQHIKEEHTSGTELKEEVSGWMEDFRSASTSSKSLSEFKSGVAEAVKEFRSGVKSGLEEAAELMSPRNQVNQEDIDEHFKPLHEELNRLKP